MSTAYFTPGGLLDLQLLGRGSQGEEKKKKAGDVELHPWAVLTPQVTAGGGVATGGDHPADLS